MQSIQIKYAYKAHLFKSIEVLLACFLFFLAFRQYQYLDTIMVKLGMSHLFSPRAAGVLPYLLLAANIASGICLILWTSRAAAIPALIVFAAYTIYSLVLYIQTGSSCGCANMFFEIDLKLQALIGLIAMTLCSLLVFNKRTDLP